MTTDSGALIPFAMHVRRAGRLASTLALLAKRPDVVASTTIDRDGTISFCLSLPSTVEWDALIKRLDATETKRETMDIDSETWLHVAARTSAMIVHTGWPRVPPPRTADEIDAALGFIDEDSIRGDR